MINFGHRRKAVPFSYKGVQTVRKLMWLSLGFGAACAWGAYFGGGYAAIMITALVLTAGFAFAGRRIGILRPAALFCAGILLGTGWFCLFDRLRLEAPRQLDGERRTVTVTCTDYSRETDYGYSVDGILELDGDAYSVRVYLDPDGDPVLLKPGYELTGEFRFKVTTDREPGESTYYQGNGVFLIAYSRGDTAVYARHGSDFRTVIADMRRGIVELLESVFPEDTAPFAKALVLGDSSGLSYEVDTAFKVSGIRHIVAVSGLHVSILFSIVYLLSGKRRVLTAVLGIPVLLLFAAVAGFTPSITRACIMQSLMVLALLFDREYDPPTALSFAALVILALNPLAVTSVSFQLSVGCMAGIFLFSSRIREWILSDKCLGEAKGKGVGAKLKRWLAGSVSVTLGAMTVTTPLCAWYFGTVSLVGIVTNLLTLWIVTYIFCGIVVSCLVGVFWLSAARMMAHVISWGIRYVILAAKFLSGIPVAAVYTASAYIVLWLIFAYILIVLFLCMKKKYPAVFACCMVIGLCASLLASWIEPLIDECRVTVMDVGQGQCVLLQSGDRAYLVDCGGQGKERTADIASQMLLSQGVSRLDGVIVTHYDADHCEGAANLLTRVDADMIFVPAAIDSAGITEDIRAVTTGEMIFVEETLQLAYDDVKLTVVPSAMLNSDNESGLCVLFQTENCAILITGDRNGFGERMLMRNIEIPELDVLVVGHHGAGDSACEELLAATTPECAIISVGEDNYYGHPAAETLERLRAFGCIIYRTDLQGTVIIRR